MQPDEQVEIVDLDNKDLNQDNPVQIGQDGRTQRLRKRVRAGIWLALLIVCLVFTILLQPVLRTASFLWPQSYVTVKNNQRTANARVEGLSPESTRTWAFTDTLFINDLEHSVFMAFDSKTGQLRWHKSIHVRDILAVDHGVIYVLETSGIVSAVQENSGAFVWSNIHILANNALLFQDAIYINALNDVFFILSIKDGRILWKMSASSGSSIIARGDSLYIADLYRIRALHLPDYKIVWEQPLSNGLSSAMQSVDEHRLVMSDARKVFALDRADGHLLWEYKVGGDFFTYQVNDNVVLISYVERGEIVAIQTTNGKELWKRTARIAEKIIGTQGSSLYLCIPETKSVLALSVQDGRQLWLYKNATMSGQCSQAEQSVYVMQGQGRVLVALDGATGVVRWMHSVPKQLNRISEIIAEKDRLYYLTFGRYTINALRSNDGQDLWVTNFAGMYHPGTASH